MFLSPAFGGNNFIATPSIPVTLTNASKISGVGRIGDGFLTLHNASTGLISDVAGGTLTIGRRDRSPMRG